MTSILDEPIPPSIIDACERGDGGKRACKEGILAARRASRWRALPSEYLGWAATYAPYLTYAQRRALIAASDNPARWRGACATHAPGLTPKERNELVAASGNPEYWRAMLNERHPPKETP